MEHCCRWVDGNCGEEVKIIVAYNRQNIWTMQRIGKRSEEQPKAENWYEEPI